MKKIKEGIWGYIILFSVLLSCAFIIVGLTAPFKYKDFAMGSWFLISGVSLFKYSFRQLLILEKKF